MDNLEKKILQLKWLQHTQIEYYCSLQKSSGKLWAKQIQEKLNKHNLPEIDNIVTQTEIKNVIKEQAMAQTTIEEIDASPVSTARKLADEVKTLAELKETLQQFTGCSLKKFATNTVIAEGVSSAKILFIGEAPGANEDKYGIPFCGESGKLLDNMLASIGISRKSNAYITNTVFWRPPGNRRPTQEEIDICRPFVEKHIALINPKLIVMVGSTAATSLLGNHDGISKIRKNNYLYNNRYLTKPIKTTAIFHPAYLLRQPMQKKTTWYDLLGIQKLLT
ncbi:MAG: uracil-DNA glycosylase [Rickettsiaceae bacterium]|nr:uracil-DNA glycosylase [Rickettsiaceae bacterium]